MSSPYVRALCLLAATLGLTSCASPHFTPPATTHVVMSGRAMGGEQAITGAAVHLYMVGSDYPNEAATDILTNPVTTSNGTGVGGDASNGFNTMEPGFFTITGDYTCPSNTDLVSDDLVYMATVGGNPGAGENDSQVNLVALGHCIDLQSVPFVTINEITTVGTIAALNPFLQYGGPDGSEGTNYASISSTSEDPALAAAFNTAAEYMNFATGTAPGPALPAGYDAASNDLRALANAVQSCVNSVSNASSLSSTCQKLFDYSYDVNNGDLYPTDTAYALWNLTQHSDENVGLIFNLQSPTPPFEPVNATAPLDWSLPILPLPGTPAFSPNPASGTYNSTQQITISDSDPTAIIYYTTDGSTPTTSSNRYYGYFNIASSSTVKAIAVESGRVSSSVASAAYTINTIYAAAPTFTPSPGTYTTTQQVSLSDSSAYYAHYYYTTDGSTPTTASAVYTGPITISASETLKAVAYASGYGLSSVSSGTYTISPSGVTNMISTIAGNGQRTYYGDGVYATTAQLSGPQSVKLYNGYAYIADTSNGAIRKVGLTTGIINTVTTASGPIYDLTFDSSGNLYYSVAYNNTAAIYRIDATTGATSTYLGGASGTSGQNGPMSSFQMAQPWGLVMDSSNDLYFADASLNKIFVVYNGGSAAANLITIETGLTPTVGYVYLIGGLSAGTAGYTADGSLATSSEIDAPSGITLDPSGNIIFSEFGNNVVRKISITTGLLSTVAGYTNADSFSSPTTNNGDGGSATGVNARFNEPVGVAYDTSGNLYIADSVDQEIRMASASNGILSSPAKGLSGQPRGVAVDTSGNIYAAQYPYFVGGQVTGGNIVSVTNSAGTTTTFAGSGAANYQAGLGGPATQAEMYFPEGVAMDPSGNLFIADSGLNRILKLDHSSGNLSLYAGISSLNGGSGGNGVATSVALNTPHSVATDSSGNVYIADTLNQVIREVTPDGNSTVIAGQVGSYGYSGDGGPATSAKLNYPWAVAVDGSNNIFVADTNNGCIREIAASNGYISTVAGNCGSSGYAGDSGPATAAAAQIGSSKGLAISSSGDIYFSDGYRVRMVYEGGANAAALLGQLSIPSPTVGDLYTIAGSSSGYGSAGDGGKANITGVKLGVAMGVAVDTSGNVYVATQDTSSSLTNYNDRVRRIDATNGDITSYVSTSGAANFSGDGGTAPAATLWAPNGVTLDSSGNLYIGDAYNRRVREVAH